MCAALRDNLITNQAENLFRINAFCTIAAKTKNQDCDPRRMTLDWYAREGEYKKLWHDKKVEHNNFMFSIKNDKLVKSDRETWSMSRVILWLLLPSKLKIFSSSSNKKKLIRWTCFWRINYGNLWWAIMMDSATQWMNLPHHPTREKMQFMKFNLRQSNISSNSHQRLCAGSVSCLVVVRFLFRFVFTKKL